MKHLVWIAAVAALVLALAWRMGPAPSQPTVVRAAGEDRVAFLIRFGADGAKGVDWSGSIQPRPLRMIGWQFDSADSIEADRWKCATREQNYWDTPYEASMKGTSNRDKVTGKGIVVEYDRQTAAEVRITTARGAVSFRAAEDLWAAPRRVLDGKVEIRSSPVLTTLATAAEEEDYPSLLEAKDGTTWLAYVAWVNGADRLMIRRRTTGAWSNPEPLTEAGGDLFRTAIAQDRAGRIWVVWSAQVKGNFDLYGRAFDGKQWTAAEQLTTAAGSDIYHALVSDREGNLHLAWQNSRSGNFDIYLRSYDGKRWSSEMQVSSDPANDWEPALAAGPDGSVAILWDTYAKGNYDIVARTLKGGKLSAPMPIASSGAFEARVSAAYDPGGRLWLAWEEGDWNWGKDYGNLIKDNGRGLMVRRQTRVAVLAEGRVREVSGSTVDAMPADFRQAFQHPKLSIDGKGNPWLFFHYRVNAPRPERGDSRTARAMWRLGAIRFQNGRWTPLIEFPEGAGRIDSMVAAAPSSNGGIDLAWASDGRAWPSAAPQTQNLLTARLPAGPQAQAVALTDFRPSTENLAPSHAEETADVARVRAYRAAVGGQNLRIVRGDVHRHTDISWDGNRDGSLDDSYRYALDAVAFDYLGVCDHQGGQVPYSWWRIQKAVDLFTIAGKFAPLYSYERSLSYPNGHRNVLFAERGRPILETSPEEQRGVEGAAKLYQYLKPLGGITTSHTSATGAGTDWRDSNAELEPVVEIYQGYRNNYEEPTAPRHTTNAEASKFAAGMVWNAWAKGLKLGVQSSSDHVSTHISYAAVYVDRIDRKAILDGFRARRSYGATDNLIIELRMGSHFMGESFSARAPEPITAYVRGAGPIARVSLIKNNRIIHTAPGAGAELKFTYTDQDRTAGKAYYYLRVEQQNGQLGWSSPVWVEIQ